MYFGHLTGFLRMLCLSPLRPIVMTLTLSKASTFWVIAEPHVQIGKGYCRDRGEYVYRFTILSVTSCVR